MDEEPDGWRLEAACKDMGPDAFFPDQGRATSEGKRTCMRCLVRVQCLEYAIEAREPYGIWGGLNEKERRKLRRERTLASLAPGAFRRGRPSAETTESVQRARSSRTIPLAADG